MLSSTKIPFATIIAALLDESKPFPPRYLNRLTDLPDDERIAFQETWPKIPTWRRQALLEDLNDLTTSDMVLSFEAIGQVALSDSEPLVRKFAVEMLNEYESPEQIPLYLKMVNEDPDSEVRAAVASGLGLYVYQGEIETLAKVKQNAIEECLLKIVRGSDVPLVRRRALESLGYSSRDEVIPLIEQAYHAGKREWLASALFAMGRSANEIWREKVLPMIDHDSAIIRAEAVTAAGELGMKEARAQLINLVEDDDERVRTAAVWALSQIGGEQVRALLEDLLDQVEDDDEVEFIEDALENLTFTEGESMFVFDFDADADDEEDDDD